MEKVNSKVEEFEAQIGQKRAEIKELAAARNEFLYTSLKTMIGKYYKNKFDSDHFFYVDAIGKETMRPLGYEIYYKSIRQDAMNIPGQWVEITKEDFEKKFNAEVSRIRYELKI